MKLIPLTKGRFAQVDDEHEEFVLAMGPWRAHRAGHGSDVIYALANTTLANGTRSCVAMHQVVWSALQTPLPRFIDHRDRDGLNCQSHNLRAASASQNHANRSIHKNNTTGFKGVIRTSSGKFAAAIKLMGKRFHLGTFLDPAVAHQAYVEAAERIYGEFSRGI